jgi:hypothetical protein
MYTKVLKLRGKQHHAAARGDEIHLKGEYFLKGAIPNVPKEFAMFKREMKTLKDRKAKAEAFWSVDRNWKPVKETDKRNRWLVAKIDAHLPDDDILHIIDYKSGRVYDSHKSQGSVYACLGPSFYPKITSVSAEFWYTDIGKLGDSPFEFTIDQIKLERAKWTREATKMLRDEKFKPTPSRSACQWCKMRSDKKLENGAPGPCDKWKKAK